MTNLQKFVIDTNVIVSASLFSQSAPRQAFDKAQDIGIILLSQSVLAEIEEVLFRSKLDRYVSREKRSEFLANFLKTAALIEVSEKIDECRDPKDNKFLVLAVSGPVE
jgi:putative PIN family toxin of toxin-antitoxin system